MKKIIVIAAALFVLSCNQGKTPEETTPPDSISYNSEPVPEPLPDSTVAKFSDEENWLSDLVSDKKESRLAAFKKYLSVRDTSDGETSEIMTGYIKTYFSTYPKEFLTQYSTMSMREKENAIDDVAYEFRASGDSFKADLDEYFEGIQQSCTDCSHDLLSALKDIKQRVYREVGKTNI